MSKTNPGNFFEDFAVGQVIEHATPRTVTEGDRALYGAIYPTRFAVPSSAAFAASVGLDRHPVEELVGFHIAFGKTVPDVSLNAVANLGYAECRFHRPVHPGDTLSTVSEVIGLKQNSNGRTGVVYVRSTARNQTGEVAIDWARWVMVHKRDAEAPAPDPVVPDLAPAVAASDLVVPDGLDFSTYDFGAAGEPHRLGDYEVGERIDHVDGVTLTDAEHMMATRLWQNTAKVHFNTEARPDGHRLVYGGHVISLARALSFNGLANAQLIAAVNAGSHVAPAFAGDTVYAWSEVLDRAATDAPGVGAIRLRLVATKGRDESMTLRDEDPSTGLGQAGRYADGVLLDLDYWALIPV
ncbi:MaoC family dehydratase [Nocardioides sp. CER19]|uniref:MaoC family dehydratase n=1 Tax=Nocardioides sp. CER19 TaxID=3038538 RepID=UPI002448066A|nr:MaoC family dehydratase [Nocardioides sp. CER19]MDH2415151.1 MaoC family dehydratase [Nocardioides sp. CER19]